MEDRFERVKVNLLKICSHAPDKFLALDLQIRMESENIKSPSTENLQLECIKKNVASAVYNIEKMNLPTVQEYLVKINQICNHITIDIFDKLEFRELHWLVRAVLEMIIMYIYKLYDIEFNNKNQLEESICELKYQLRDSHIPSAFNSLYELKSVCCIMIHEFQPEIQDKISHLSKMMLCFNWMSMDILEKFIRKSTGKRKREDDKSESSSIKKYSESYRKTKMCKYVQKNGKCFRGETCSFAHSFEELKQTECMFGNKCNDYRCTYYHPSIYE